MEKTLDFKINELYRSFTTTAPEELLSTINIQIIKTIWLYAAMSSD